MTEPSPHRTLRVAPADDGERLDRFLVRQLPALGRRAAAELIAAGHVRIERDAGPRPTTRKGERVRAGDRVLVQERAAGLDRSARSTPPRPARVPGVVLLHEDAELLVIAKPAKIPCHPLRPQETGTVANHLAHRFPDLAAVGGDPREGGLCHRLDTLTSGLLVAARTPAAHRHLRTQFREHQVEKTYLALVEGVPEPRFTLEAPIASRRGRRRVDVGTGQPALTRITLQRSFRDAALVEAETRYGRRHQVRAHLAHAGHPLVADDLYGGAPVVGWERPPLLHAAQITFTHPERGDPVTFHCELSEEVRSALDRLDAA